MSEEVREPRGFEPPPWERDRFEELRLQREAEQAAGTEAPEDIAPSGVPGPEQKVETPVATGGTRGEDESLDPAGVDAMLMELRAQEPDAAAPVLQAAVVAAGFVLVIGVGLLVAAVIGALRGLTQVGGFGIAGVVMLTGFGLALAGAGGWILVQTLRQRGA